MLGAYIFIIVISSWIDPLIIMLYPSFSLFTAVISKSILSDLSIATPAFFWSQLHEISFSSPSLSLLTSCNGEGNATHSSVLAWRILGMGEPGRLSSMGSHSQT